MKKEINMNALKKVTRAKVELCSQNLYNKVKQNKKFNQGCILLGVLNRLKYDCDTLESLDNDMLSEQADTIQLLALTLENFDELKPMIIKYVNEKARKEKFELLRKSNDIER